MCTCCLPYDVPGPHIVRPAARGGSILLDPCVQCVPIQLGAAALRDIASSQTLRGAPRTNSVAPAGRHSAKLTPPFNRGKKQIFIAGEYRLAGSRVPACVELTLQVRMRPLQCLTLATTNCGAMTFTWRAPLLTVQMPTTALRCRLERAARCPLESAACCSRRWGPRCVSATDFRRASASSCAH